MSNTLLSPSTTSARMCSHGHLQDIFYFLIAWEFGRVLNSVFSSFMEGCATPVLIYLTFSVKLLILLRTEGVDVIFV